MLYSRVTKKKKKTDTQKKIFQLIHERGDKRGRSKKKKIEKKNKSVTRFQER